MATYTAYNAIIRSLRIIGELAENETPSHNDADDALDMLNQMLHGWSKLGVDLNHETMQQQDLFTFDDSYVDGVVLNLAVKAAREFGKAVSPDIKADAERYFRSFQAATHEFEQDLKMDRALDPRYNQGRYGSYNIDDG